MVPVIKFDFVCFGFRLFLATLSTSWIWILVRRNTFRSSSTTSSKRASRAWAMQRLKTFWTNRWFCSDTSKKKTPSKSITSDIWLDDCSIRNPLPTIQKRWWSANSSQSVGVSSHQSSRVCSRTWRCPTPSTRSSRVTCSTLPSRLASWRIWVCAFWQLDTGQARIHLPSSTCQECRQLLSTSSRTSIW